MQDNAKLAGESSVADIFITDYILANETLAIINYSIYIRHL